MINFNQDTPEISGSFRDPAESLKDNNNNVSELDFGISEISAGVDLDYGEHGLQRCHKPFPMRHLPGEIRQIVSALYGLSDSPIELCVQSAFSRISLAIGGGYDGQHFVHERPMPLCLAQISIAESGERKSTADSLLHAPLQAHIESLNAMRNSEEQLWPLVTDLTAEGVINQLPKNPAISLSSADAGSFMSGYAMDKDRRAFTASVLCELWSGQQILQLRAGGNRKANNPRVDMSLMAQEVFAKGFLGSQLLDSQGLLGRFLTYLPKSQQGNRSAVRAVQNRQLLKEHAEFIKQSGNRLTTLYDEGLELFDAKQDRRLVRLSNEGVRLLAEYHDELEAMRCRGGLLRNNAWANRAPEHATRLATIFAVYKDKEIVDIEEVNAGIGLASHFLHTYLLMEKYFSMEASNVDAICLWKYLALRYELDAEIDGTQVLKNRGAKAEEFLRQAETLVEWGAVEITDRTKSGTVRSLKLAARPD